MTDQTATATVEHPSWCDPDLCHPGDWYPSENVHDGKPVGLPALSGVPPEITWIAYDQPDHQRRRVVDQYCTIVTTWTRGQQPFVSMDGDVGDLHPDGARALLAALTGALEDCDEAERLEAVQR